MGNPLTARVPKPGKPSKVHGRAARFTLLRTAQRVLNDKTASMKGQHETVWCHRSSHAEYSADVRISVYRAADGSDASVHGLTTCGNVWTCPVCSARVAEERRRELQFAMLEHTKRGGHAYLMTLTFSHREGDRLDVLRDMQAKALTAFKQSRAFRNVSEQYGRIGSVKGLEVTHGENGWHPHTHDLMFASAGMLEDPSARRALKRAWLEACIKVGLVQGVRVTGRGKTRRMIVDLPTDGSSRWASIRNHWKHGLDLSGGERAAEYIAKFGHDESWGITSEVTRGVAKVGTRASNWTKGMHVTPFQLLEFASQGDARASALFREYAAAWRGKRQLVWSRGLKDEFGVREATDEELAAGADPMPDREEVARLDTKQWSVILSRAAIGEFLVYAAECCFNTTTAQEDIDEYIRHLKRRPATARGTMAIRHSFEGLTEALA